MKWSFSIGRLAGIDVRIHATFFLLLAWVAYSGWAAEGTVMAALRGMTLIAILFGIVVLHELGHALTARHFGIPTRDITLLPIGGVARIERMPDDPRHELLVAIAGPAVNIALAIGLGVILWTLGHDWFGDVTHMGLLSQLFWINLSLAFFNMIPAFPMDGGRALRAFLAMRIDSVRATEVAARLGKITAFGFGLLGLFGSPLLLLIALFVWLGAESEVTAARFEGALAGLPVAAATIREFHTLAPTDRLEVAAAHAVAGFQHDFPVLDGAAVVGSLPHRTLLAAITERGLDARVADAMEAPPPLARPDEMLVDAFRRLEESEARYLLVANEAGHLLGLLTLESLGELFAIRRAVGVHTALHDRALTG